MTNPDSPDNQAKDSDVGGANTWSEREMKIYDIGHAEGESCQWNSVQSMLMNEFDDPEDSPEDTTELADFIKQWAAQEANKAVVEAAKELFYALKDVWANPPANMDRAPEDLVWNATEIVNALNSLEEEWLEKITAEKESSDE